MIDFNLLNDHLNSISLTVLEEIVPGGVLRGNEYTAGSELGGPGDSFSYNIKKHCGQDFASGLIVGDLISLFSKIKNISQVESAKILADKFGFVQPQQITDRPNMHHKKFGNPTMYWEYFFQTGSIAFIEARYDLGKGEKIFLPWEKLPNGEWNCGLKLRSRPLYKLLDLMRSPKDTQVIITEGCKAADACQKIVGNRAIVVTWSGGAPSPMKTDFSPLFGRKVIIWPDADAPGIDAAYKIKYVLAPHCKNLAMINTDGLPEKFDAADFDGCWDELKEFVSKRAKKTEYVEIGLNPPPINKVSAVVEKKQEDAPIFNGSLHSIWEKFGIALSSNGKPIPNLDNITRIFERCNEFQKNIWYDDFYKRYYTAFRCKPRAWTNIDDFLFTQKIQREFGISNISDNIVNDAMRLHAHKNKRCDPVDWLNSIEWDGVFRINTLFPDAVFCIKDEYSCAVSRNFMLSMVARLLIPGCKVDTMVILEGGQGKKKSTFFEALAGKKWYTQAIESVHSNNFYQCLDGKLIIEFAELHQFAKSDILKVKQMLSNAVDTYRTPYDRSPEDHPRMSIFAGTTNESVYLKDDTGARRFWPIKIGSEINLKYIHKNREQLFAEAVAIIKSESVDDDADRQVSSWWRVPEDLACEVQEDRRIRDPWQEDIDLYISGREIVTTTEIIEGLFSIAKRDKTKIEEIRVTAILKLLGWERFSHRDGHRVFKAWRRASEF